MPPRKKKAAAKAAPKTEVKPEVKAAPPAPKQRRIVMKRVMQLENGQTDIDQIYDIVKNPAPIGYEISEAMADIALERGYGKISK